MEESVIVFWMIYAISLIGLMVMFAAIVEKLKKWKKKN